MQRIVHISAHNFMTFEDVELTFDGKCYVIRGDNKDDSGQRSNGAGKSSLLDIIAVALLGQSLSGRDIKDCVNWNGADSFFTVTVVLKDGVTRSEDYEGPVPEITTTITRKVYNNTRSAELSIAKDGRPVKGVPTKAGIENGVDIKAGNQYILDYILGVSKDDLLNYFLISGDQYESFFAAGQAKKLEIITRFSKAQVVDEVIGKLALIISNLISKRGEIERNIARLAGELTGLRSSVDPLAIEAFEKDKQRRIDYWLRMLDDHETKLLALVPSDVPDVRLDLPSKDWDAEIASKRQEIKDNRSMLREAEEKLQLLKNEYSELYAIVSGEIICPSCDYHFVLDGDIETVKHRMADLAVSQLGVQQDATLINDEIQQGELILEHFIRSRSEEADMKAEAERDASKADMLKKYIADYEEKILKIEAETFYYGDVQSKITEKQLAMDLELASITTLEQQVAEHDAWYDRFKEFKFYLANKPIEVICHYTNEFLRDIGSELSVSIEGFKVLKSGELKAELTPLVYRNGVNPKLYSAFSGGEKVRLNLAVDLALQRLVNDNSSEGLQFYSNDESINALDSTGVASVAKALNKLNQTICLITHSGSDLNYDNNITIQKTGQVSRIIL
jgi:DNA repair exonuclease SbcCD ATPase subunit